MKLFIFLLIFRYGYTAVKHQREVGTGYFDYVANAAAGGSVSTAALKGSTEEAQFQTAAFTEENEIVTVSLFIFFNCFFFKFFLRFDKFKKKIKVVFIKKFKYYRKIIIY